jgi:hypothetical protein
VVTVVSEKRSASIATISTLKMDAICSSEVKTRRITIDIFTTVRSSSLRYGILFLCNLYSTLQHSGILEQAYEGLEGDGKKENAPYAGTVKMLSIYC